MASNIPTYGTWTLWRSTNQPGMVGKSESCATRQIWWGLFPRSDSTLQSGTPVAHTLLLQANHHLGTRGSRLRVFILDGVGALRIHTNSLHISYIYTYILFVFCLFYNILNLCLKHWKETSAGDVPAKWNLTRLLKFFNTGFSCWDCQISFTCETPWMICCQWDCLNYDKKHWCEKRTPWLPHTQVDGERAISIFFRMCAKCFGFLARRAGGGALFASAVVAGL